MSGESRLVSRVVESRVPLPNLADYETARSDFSWDSARAALDGLPGNRGLNIAFEAVDRHILAGNGGRVALRMLGKVGARLEVSYDDLATRTSRFANVLGGLGVSTGDVVAILCGRQLDLYVAVLGALKHRCVVSPLFSAFGPEPIRARLELGKARVLVTTPELYARKVAALRSALPLLATVIVTGGNDTCPDGAIALDPLLDEASSQYEIGPTDPETPALLHFTSGTTGTPKGALHVHNAVVAHAATGRLALDLQDGDVFWCTADPGWVTGMSYGVIAPLVCGVTLVVDEAELDPARWYAILADEEVCVWYTAPTAVRMLMRAGTDVPNLERPRPRLRLAASVGEPLPADAVIWSQNVLGLPMHDNWWQTETGGIMVANFRALPIRPGSMGRPLPGIDAGVVACDEDGTPLRDGDGNVQVSQGAAEGMLALRAGWPSMFRAYLDAPERYAACFARSGDATWYLSGDLVRVDEDGYFWFVARADDVIKTSGHLIGPFEVESVLIQHPDVVDAGVYGVPDPVAGALVHAVIVLRAGVADSEDVRRSVLAHARSRLGAAVAPRLIQVAATLPKTRSGKIMRRLLRARELGLPEGDTSTLESGNVGNGAAA
ncbi:MAG TPA: acetate--CoA ligase [Ilumatobacteraceae bacterium]|nr:acetate--CoA ligase [Ilumatobacteraceae bacterium]